ncbi:hypothetical protein ACFX5Q_30490 [Mesorhizobium sp. IMUNJ 23033]|uniref:hypothetical protein n=1 Tax=Mesorhizobium sp. IMUNJ 23033 TaxID=3378039 RepID=UPI00384F91DC
MLLIPPFIAANGTAPFLVSYFVGRLVIPALVPPGYDSEGSLLQRVAQTIQDFVFDSVFSKAAALIFVVIIPWVMGRLIGEPPLVQSHLVFLATHFPPPSLQAYSNFSPHSFSMSGWFYVALMAWLPHRFVVQLGLRRAIIASMAGILMIGRIDLATQAALDIGGGWSVSPLDVAVALFRVPVSVCS